ncbi:MAG: zinc ribbon domain-containing protein [Clostridiales bacterium]|nr:zinc ribbon domain-containing protein [Clostridiales bacterium]
MICKKCNTDNNDKFTYCYNCGASLDPNAKDDAFAPDMSEDFAAYDSERIKQILNKKASSSEKKQQTDYNVLLEMTLASSKSVSPVSEPIADNGEDNIPDTKAVNEDNVSDSYGLEQTMVPTDDEITSIFAQRSNDAVQAEDNVLNEEDYIPADIRKKNRATVSSESEVDKKLNKFAKILAASASSSDGSAERKTDTDAEADDFFSQTAINSLENNAENNTIFNAAAVESVAKAKKRNSEGANDASYNTGYNTFDDDLKTLSEGVNYRKTTSVPFSGRSKKKKPAVKKAKAPKDGEKKNKQTLYRIIAILVLVLIAIGLFFTVRGIVNSISTPDPTPSVTPDTTPNVPGDISFTVTDGTETVDGFKKYSFHITTNANKVIVLGEEHIPDINDSIVLSFDERVLYDFFYEDSAVYGDPLDISLEFKAVLEGADDYVTTKSLTVNAKYVSVTDITPSVDSVFETAANNVEISFTTVPGASVVIDSQDLSEYVDAEGHFSATLSVPSETKLFFVTVSAEKHRPVSFEINVHRDMARYFTCDQVTPVKADKKEVVTLTGTVSPGSTITVSDYITVTSPAQITEAGTYTMQLLMPKFGYVAFTITATLNGESTSIDIVADNMQDWSYYSRTCWAFTATEYDNVLANDSYRRGQRYVFDATITSLKKEADRYTALVSFKGKDGKSRICNVQIMTTDELRFVVGDSVKIYGNRYGITDSHPTFYTNAPYMYKN